jgi:hypothetical protein
MRGLGRPDRKPVGEAEGAQRVESEADFDGATSRDESEPRSQ